MAHQYKYDSHKSAENKVTVVTSCPSFGSDCSMKVDQTIKMKHFSESNWGQIKQKTTSANG